MIFDKLSKVPMTKTSGTTWQPVKGLWSCSVRFWKSCRKLANYWRENVEVNEGMFTDVRFMPTKPDGSGLLGYACCRYNGEIALNSIKVYRLAGESIRLTFPDVLLPSGKRINIYYPTSTTVYNALVERVKEKVDEQE